MQPMNPNENPAPELLPLHGCAGQACAGRGDSHPVRVMSTLFGHPDCRRLARLLHAGCERPCDQFAAEKSDEFAASHSITSSARASSVGGSLKPSACAVLRLMRNSKRVGN